MVAEIARVVAGAVDQSRFAAAQELQAHQVQAGRVDDPAVVVHLGPESANRNGSVTISVRPSRLPMSPPSKDMACWEEG